jgi:hypothetical protein
MATDGMQEQRIQKEVRHNPNSGSISHLSGCSSVALWLVVGTVGTYILYGLLVWLTSSQPISALR